MKLKFAVPLLVLSVASTSALAAASTTTTQSGATNNSGFLNQQFLNMNNGTGSLVAGQNWFNHIGVSGLLNVDAWSQSNKNFLAGNTATRAEPSQSNIGVDTLRLNFDANVNSWVNGHISLFYADQDQPAGISGAANTSDNGGNFHDSTPSTRYYASSNTTSGVDVDQAYVDVGNFSQSPIMLRAGKQYVPFGSYRLDTIAPTLTQQLSETRATAVQVGVATQSGFHGGVYGFKGLQKQNVTGDDDQQVNGSNNIGNGGVAVGYTNLAGAIGFDLGAQYLYNMADVGSIAQYLSSYNTRVGAWAGNATLMTGPFSLGVKMVSAVGSFKQSDLAYASNAAETGTAPEQGASPSAGTVLGTYAFNTYGYGSLLSASYQWSKQAFDAHGNTSASVTGFALPASRWGAEYDVNVLQNTMLGFEFHHDNAYNKANLGTGLSSNTGTVRLSVLL